MWTEIQYCIIISVFQTVSYCIAHQVLLMVRHVSFRKVLVYNFVLPNLVSRDGLLQCTTLLEYIGM